MAHFSYSLFLSLIHSFWQSAVLIGIFLISDLFFKRSNPLSKRNILYIFLATQVFISISTFLIYYSGTSFEIFKITETNISNILIQISFFERAAPWISGTYLFILGFKTLWLAYCWNQFNIPGKPAYIKPPIDLKLFTSVKANEFGIYRKVKLWYSHTVNTPITFGFLKPVILLPVALVNHLSIAETESLIIHELTHIKSNDYVLNWFLIICENLYFFNPFVLLITSKIKLEREKNCDSWVLQFNYPALNYAETLLKTARFKTTPVPFILTAVFKNTQLINRIRFFTEEKNLRFHHKHYSRFTFVPVIAMIVLNFMVLNLNRDNHLLDSFSKHPAAPAFSTVEKEKIIVHFSAPLLAERNVIQLSEIKVEDLLSKKETDTNPLQKEKGTRETANPIITAEPMPQNFARPVLLGEGTETNKEIILTEENSATGRSVTRVYQMNFENGKWVTELLWEIRESRPGADSLSKIRDTIRFNQQSQ